MSSATKLSPRYHVVSLRVSNEELEDIKSLVRREKTTVSELLRDALNEVRRRCKRGSLAGAVSQQRGAGCLN